MRWDWYSYDAHDLRPFWYERNRLPHGKRLEHRPALSENVMQYGFDEVGRVMVERQFSGLLGGRLIFEATRTYHDDGVIEELGVDGDGDTVHTHRYLFDDGLLRTFVSTARHGNGREEYAYIDGRVTSIAASHREVSPRDSGERGWDQRNAIFYDEDGRLQRIETTWLVGTNSPYTVTTYRRPPEGVTLDGQCRDLTKRLIEQVPKVVARERVAEPAYCLTLTYGGDLCLPVLGIGLASERQAWLARHNNSGGDNHSGGGNNSGDGGPPVWNPAEFTHFDTDALALDDAALLDAADLLGQELRLAGEFDERTRGMLLKVAHALNRYEWSRVLPTTADFLVYPVDHHLVDLERNLGECRQHLT